MDTKPKDSPLIHFDTLPADAFVRFPIVCALWSVSASTGRRLIDADEIPKPYRIGPRVRCWRVGDLRDCLAARGKVGAQ